jgi:hypothetical protein
VHTLCLVVCLTATCVYGVVAFIATPSKPAFWFLVLPPVSLALIATTYLSSLRK